MKTPKKQIAIYGGAFDPPHNGHALVISSTLNSELVDEIWLVPTGDNRYDKTTIASGEDRKTLLFSFIKECFPNETLKIKIDTTQLENLTPESTSYSLVKYLEAKYSNLSFSLLIGSENLAQLKNWKESEKLLKETNFLVASRPGYSCNDLPTHSKIIPMRELSDISSTRIREFIKDKKDLTDLVCASVQSIIKAKKLYE